MLVALIGAFGDTPAQVENAARLDDVEHAPHRRRNLRAVKMHDHGFAQHIVVSIGYDATQFRVAPPTRSRDQDSVRGPQLAIRRTRHIPRPESHSHSATPPRARCRSRYRRWYRP